MWKTLMGKLEVSDAAFVVIHSTFCCFILYYGAVYATAMITVLWVTHILIDTGTCYFNRKNKQTLVFLADQALHIGMIGLLLRFVTFSCYIDDYYVALKVVFVGLMLLMPCSILINKLLQDIYPESEEMGIFDIGSMIGIMERILTVIFAYFDNFPAVAIIITIKPGLEQMILKNQSSEINTYWEL